MSRTSPRRSPVRQRRDLAAWVAPVAAAAVHHSSQTSLVTYAAVRTLYLRRTFADIEAHTVLSALCSAAAPARSTSSNH